MPDHSALYFGHPLLFALSYYTMWYYHPVCIPLFGLFTPVLLRSEDKVPVSIAGSEDKVGVRRQREQKRGIIVLFITEERDKYLTKDAIAELFKDYYVKLRLWEYQFYQK